MRTVQWLMITACLGSIHILANLSCQRSPSQKVSRNSLEKKQMQDKNQQLWQDGTEVYFILSDQSVIQEPKHPPFDFYVKGIIQGNKFVPKSTVLGIGELAKEGRYGWLELHSKEFFPMESDRMALTPFVKGYMTTGGFVPSMREVFSEP